MLGRRLRSEQGWKRGGRACDDSRGGEPGDERRGFDDAFDGRDGDHGAGAQRRAGEQRRSGQAAGGEEPQEGRDGQDPRERRGELRRGHVLEQHQKDSVNRGVRGVGLGLRWDFTGELVERTSARGGARLPLDFLEVSPENYLRRGGKHPAVLGWLAERYPIVTHGLTMSLGGTGALDPTYLHDLRSMLEALGTPWHSDHLSMGAVDGRALHDLLPVAFKEAAVERIADRIRHAREAIGMPLAIENVSYYWHPGRAELGEAEFLARVCEAADCGLVLDVNNAYVNCQNFGVDVEAWMRAAPLERVVQIHVAGHEWFAADERGLGDAVDPHAEGALIVDTHGAPVPDPVLDLLERALAHTGPVPVLLERDQNVPSLDPLLEELTRIRAIYDRATAQPRE